MRLFVELFDIWQASLWQDGVDASGCFVPYVVYLLGVSVVWRMLFPWISARVAFGYGVDAL